jgi:hypothetical protein
VCVYNKVHIPKQKIKTNDPTSSNFKERERDRKRNLWIKKDK